MDGTEDEDDLGLIKASATLLTDLEDALPKLLWKPAKSGNGRKVHTQVSSRDLVHVTKLIEPFQSEPQLLDARLKHILPPIVEAYLAYIQRTPSVGNSTHLDSETAVCCLLYTLCKVRGYKVILGFLSNEPRYLEPILLRLEDAVAAEPASKPQWQVPYVLLLWLSHLLLTPFDLASISGHAAQIEELPGQWPDDLPPVVSRILHLGQKYLSVSTKAQDAASMLLVRLVKRPDMQKLRLGDSCVAQMLRSLQETESDQAVTVYERLGPLRLLSGVAASPELCHLTPEIYRACQGLTEAEGSFVATNAVAKKLAVKIFRDIAVLSVKSHNAQGALLSFFETNSVLEDVIDYLLRSLEDRDTPVRFAAAKAISLIVLELDQEMREEVIQAVLDTFKEDMPRTTGQTLDFRTANALRWHGLTLCLAHTVFKRSASPAQLPDIVTALVSAMQFEQRTATRSTIGTNVRDAANFGIWSLSRRYTTAELLSVESFSLRESTDTQSIIQQLATELVLSACLDPAGNVRRGSSAALQELIGRHPNQVKEGITLVQTVDYLAVGLRSKGMVDVAVKATEVDAIYFEPVWRALLAWRGLGSADVSSREAAATSLARLTEQGFDLALPVVDAVLKQAATIEVRNFEMMHGLVRTIASTIAATAELEYSVRLFRRASDTASVGMPQVLARLDLEDFSSRLLRSELPSAIAKMLAAYCALLTKRQNIADSSTAEPEINFDILEYLTERLLTRSEENIREDVPALARWLLELKRKHRRPLGCLGGQTLAKQVAIDGAKSTFQGAGRAMSLGALASLYDKGLRGSKAADAMATLSSLTDALNVDWRIIGIRAIQLAVESIAVDDTIEPAILEVIVDAVHRGLNDYTIDERGDVGSLVRLQAIASTSSIFSACIAREQDEIAPNSQTLQVLQADIYRLSLEKLDRVRLAAARCHAQHLTYLASPAVNDIAEVSSYDYFIQRFAPLSDMFSPPWKHRAVLTGAMSACGISSESLLQASRSALANTLIVADIDGLQQLMTLYTDIIKESLASPTSPLTTPALLLLAFLLEMRTPQRLTPGSTKYPFKWLNMLSAVQKSHHKSNDIPKIAAAVAVYRGLAEVEAIRNEVMKKLMGMLKTNPYPRVRVMVAEALLVSLTDDQSAAADALKAGDWMDGRKSTEGEVKMLEERLLMA